MDTMTGPSPTATPFPLIKHGLASSATIMRSSQIWAAGFKKLGDIMAETAKGHFDQTAAAWQAMSQVRTLAEAVEIQTSYARRTAEHSIARAKTLVEATNQLTQEAMSPMIEQLANHLPASGFVPRL